MRQAMPCQIRLGLLVVTTLVSLAACAGCGHDKPKHIPPPPVRPKPVLTPVKPPPVAVKPPEFPWPKGVHKVEHFEEGQLSRFFDKLRQVKAGRLDKVRVIHFGDSHIAADIWTGQLRRAFQTHFGDGGHGFMYAGKPWKSYFHMDADNGMTDTRSWTVERKRTGKDISDGLGGLGGITLYSSKKGASVWISTEDDGPVGTAAKSVEVFYLKQPRGGGFNLLVNGKKVKHVKTRGKRVEAAYFRHELPSDGPVKAEVVVTGGGQVRLFGMVLESGANGVVYDSVGINGARVTMPLAWDETFWKEQLAHRQTDLFVATYGTNEVDDTMDMATYAERYREMLQRAKEALPEADCLVVGPPDRAWRLEGEAATFDIAEAARMRAAEDLGGDQTLWDTPQRLLDIVETERKVAKEEGCAFWSTMDAMGGPGAIDIWARDKPPRATSDRVHLTRAGYAEVAQQLFDALMFVYDYRNDEETP